MMRNVIILFCIFLFATHLFAQNEQQEINEIKSSLNFLYAMGTSKISGEDASTNAKDLLVMEIEQWLKENAADCVTGYVAKSRENLSLIKTKRGNLFRVFAYVKKKDVLPYYKEESVMVVDIVGVSADKNANKDTANVKVDSLGVKKSTAFINSLPNVEDKNSENNTVQTNTPKNTDARVLAYVPTQQESLMLGVSSFNELNTFINSGREAETIIAVGKYSNLPQQGLVYVFIHNKQGQIPACMKVVDGKAINLRTGLVDKMSNYKGCGAIWIKYKNDL